MTRDVGDVPRRAVVKASIAAGSVFVFGSLAGCSDSSDAADPESGAEDPTVDATSPSDPSPTDDSGGSGDDHEGALESVDLSEGVSPGLYRMMEFAGPVTLEYETDTGSGGDGTFVVDVRDVQPDAATFDIEYARGDLTQTTTFAGDYDAVSDNVFTSEAEQLFSSLFITHSGNHHNMDLDVGVEWNTRTGLPGENRIRITGTARYAGIEGYVSELTIDDVPLVTLGLRPGFGIPLHAVLYDRDGVFKEQATLASYARQ